MQVELLASSAAAIGLLHTLAGPDHYLPFAALGAARGWSGRRTLAVTALCGVAHVGASILLGMLAVSLGWSLGQLLQIDGVRADFTAWLLIGCGLAYALWGAKQARRARCHAHEHVHVDGRRHDHRHDHAGGHLHPHPRTGLGPATVWSLFIIFLFGPCEPLVPLVLAPASQGDWSALLVVCAAFGAATLAAMLGAVALLRTGLMRAGTALGGGVTQLAAGVTVACCGVAILLGL